MDAITTEPVTITHGEVVVMRCQVVGGEVAEDVPVLIEASLEASKGLCVVEGIQQVICGVLEVVLANPGPETITIPAATKLLTAQAVSTTDRIVVSPADGVLHVSVRPVLVEPGSRLTESCQNDMALQTRRVTESCQSSSLSLMALRTACHQGSTSRVWIEMTRYT